jgi:hypothetical protein
VTGHGYYNHDPSCVVHIIFEKYVAHACLLSHIMHVSNN